MIRPGDAESGEHVVILSGQVVLCGAAAEVLPREDFVRRALAVGIPGGVDACSVERLLPEGGIELLFPTVEACAGFVSVFDDVGESAVTAGEDRFENGSFDGMCLDPDGAAFSAASAA